MANPAESPKLAPAAPVLGDGEVPFRVTDACLAHCVFCAEHVPRRTPDLATDAVLVRLRDLLHQRIPRRLLLTGGEPALHPRLPELIALARAAGVAEVVLATHGAPLADVVKLATWRQAGLTGARVLLVAANQEDASDLTRLADSWRWQRMGLLAALHHGLRCEVETPVLTLTAPNLPEIAAWLAALHQAERGAKRPGLAGWRLLPYISHPPGAPANLHALPRTIEPLLLQALTAASSADLPLALPPNQGWHACAFDDVHKLRGLLARTSGGLSRVYLPQCHDCAVRQQCPGVEATLAGQGGPDLVRPFRDAQKAAWLPLHRGGTTRTADGRERNVQVPVSKDEGQGREVHELVVRIVHQCNQRCAFCWVDFEAPRMELAEVKDRVDQGFTGGQTPTVAFTGGEPLLHPQVLEMIAYAHASGAPTVSLQTNASRVRSLEHARQLAQAGLGHALVSLHAADAAASDHLTAAPGTFERTVQGIRWLCEAGISVTINHVLTRDLAPKFAEFVRFVANELAHPKLGLTLAVAGHIDAGPIDQGVLPTHRELGPWVAQGVLLAKELGVQVVGLLHPCGLVPCALPDPWPVLDAATLRPPALDDSAVLRDGGVKSAECERCALNRMCFGLRREYVQVHGLAELHAIAPRS